MALVLVTRIYPQAAPAYHIKHFKNLDLAHFHVFRLYEEEPTKAIASYTSIRPLMIFPDTAPKDDFLENWNYDQSSPD